MASPRKFSEKIALHNQKQAEETAAFEQIMFEVESATKNVLTGYDEMKQPNNSRYRDCRSKAVVHRKRVDVSPYGSPYLSPPLDTNWRRTNSDSALHQSASNQTESYNGSTPSSRRMLDGGGIMDNQGKVYYDAKKQLHVFPQHSRPKSCEVPGINIFPSEQDPSIVHIPVANNTGSLPDLTNLQFPSPLSNPIDVEEQSIYDHDPNRLKLPLHNNSLLHTCKSITIDPTDPVNAFTQQSSPVSSSQHNYDIYTQQFGIHPPPLTSVTTNQMSNYRTANSPADTTCSAPQSPVSQTLSPAGSPGLGPSPKSPFSDPYSYNLQSQEQTNAFQEHFEQLNMGDTPPTSAVNSAFLQELQYSHVSNMGLLDGRDIVDNGVYFGSPQMSSYNRHSQSTVITTRGQQTTPQTPQTPSSIPDIVLTGPGDDLLDRQDFSSAMISGSFDSELYVPEDFKANLDPLDIDGLEMLNEAYIVADTATEDTFRSDCS